MTPQRCIEAGKNGDCFRACIATITDTPIREVPNFIAFNPDDGEEMLRRANQWLRGRGLCLFTTYCSAGWELKDLLRVFSGDNPGVPMIVAGVPVTNPNATHAVVALNGEIVHDPSGAGLKSPYPCPCEDESCQRAYWYVYIVSAFPCAMENERCAA